MFKAWFSLIGDVLQSIVCEQRRRKCTKHFMHQWPPTMGIADVYDKWESGLSNWSKAWDRYLISMLSLVPRVVHICLIIFSFKLRKQSLTNRWEGFLQSNWPLWIWSFTILICTLRLSLYHSFLKRYTVEINKHKDTKLISSCFVHPNANILSPKLPVCCAECLFPSDVYRRFHKWWTNNTFW